MVRPKILVEADPESAVRAYFSIVVGESVIGPSLQRLIYCSRDGITPTIRWVADNLYPQGIRSTDECDLEVSEDHLIWEGHFCLNLNRRLSELDN